MKRVVFIFSLLITTISCQDVIEVDVPEGPERLVVNASLKFYLNESPISFENEIQLTLSTPFFDEEIPTVNNATVYITNLDDNSIINYENIGEGVYIPEGSQTNTIADFNTTYELTVVYNNETFKATTQMQPAVPIDTIEQGDGTFFGGDETEIIVTFTDDGTRDDFYLFDFGFDLIEVSEDRFYQGQSFSFSYFYEDMFAGQEITLKILGIDEQFYNYAFQVIELSDQDNSDPFQVPPSVTRGNILNTENPDNFALGYFSISEAYRLNFTIE